MPFIFLQSLAGHCEIKRQFSLHQVDAEMKSWQQAVDSDKSLNSSEKRQELSFISRLKDRLDAENTFDYSITNFKNALEFLDKSSKKGANSLYASEAHFITQNLKLLQELEPNENPISVLKSYMKFSSIESSQPIEEFQNTRSYISRDSSMSSDPDDLDEAATVVEEKIFHQHSSESL